MSGQSCIRVRASADFDRSGLSRRLRSRKHRCEPHQLPACGVQLQSACSDPARATPYELQFPVSDEPLLVQHTLAEEPSFTACTEPLGSPGREPRRDVGQRHPWGEADFPLSRVCFPPRIPLSDGRRPRIPCKRRPRMSGAGHRSPGESRAGRGCPRLTVLLQRSGAWSIYREPACLGLASRSLGCSRAVASLAEPGQDPANGRAYVLARKRSWPDVAVGLSGRSDQR
jgi:hypothetical protein